MRAALKRALFLAAVVFAIARTGPFDAAAQSDNKRVVHAFLAKEKENKPTTKFSADVPGIYVVWKGEHLQAGDEIRVVWIAEDVGAASPKETKINEGSVTAYKPDDTGSISLSRPKGRIWPIGNYRAEIYIGRQLVQALRFSIQSGVSVELN